MKKEYRCPYCNSNINYFTRLVNRDRGEYVCKNCNKASNITQDKKIWITLVISAVAALIIMILYLTSADAIIKANRNNGSFPVMNFIFFGNSMIIKWIIWEIIPFAVFLFLSPLFMNYMPQKRHMEKTNTKIDLSVPSSINSHNQQRTDANANKKNTNEMHKVYSGVYEDISSSSDVEKTKHFNVYNNKTEQANAYSDTPLKKVVRTEVETGFYDEKDDVKTYEKKEENKKTGNYSGNRMF